MALIKQELDDAAIECGLTPPTSWLTSPDETAVQFVSIMRAVVEDLLDRHDWSRAAEEATIAPLVETAVWSLPADFERFQREGPAVLEVSPNRRPAIFVTGQGQWRDMVESGWAGASRFCRLTSAGLEFYRPLPAGAVVKVNYQTAKWVLGGETAFADESTDKPIFPSRLIRLGVVARWRKQKGYRYSDEAAEYEAGLARAIGEDAPRRSFTTDGPNDAVIHPMRVPVPDFIGSG
jgi:hypothetical protein